jgi:hypothetical protein
MTAGLKPKHPTAHSSLGSCNELTSQLQRNEFGGHLGLLVVHPRLNSVSIKLTQAAFYCLETLACQPCCYHLLHRHERPSTANTKTRQPNNHPGQLTSHLKCNEFSSHLGLFVVHPGLNSVSIKFTQREPRASVGGNNGSIDILTQNTTAAGAAGAS